MLFSLYYYHTPEQVISFLIMLLYSEKCGDVALLLEIKTFSLINIDAETL